MNNFFQTPNSEPGGGRGDVAWREEDPRFHAFVTDSPLLGFFLSPEIYLAIRKDCSEARSGQYAAGGGSSKGNAASCTASYFRKTNIAYLLVPRTAESQRHERGFTPVRQCCAQLGSRARYRAHRERSSDHGRCKLNFSSQGRT